MDEKKHIMPGGKKSTWPALAGSGPEHHETPYPRAATRVSAAANAAAERTAILTLNAYEFFAQLGKRVINPGGIAGRDRLLAVLKPMPGSRVLEVGCGSGHTACYLAERFQCQVTAVDLSAIMIAAARQRVADAGLSSRVQCETADVTWLPFAESTFDYVIVQAVLMFVDKTRALAEIHRVLKPGGRLGGIEFAWRQTPPESVRDATQNICGCTVLEFHPRGEWAAWLLHAGFDRVQSDERPFALLSIPGFLRDEGVLNSLRVVGRVLRRRANRQRMAGLWRHFARHRAHFSYVVLTGQKIS
jgi:SAM-dependent methyltransferase